MSSISLGQALCIGGAFIIGLILVFLFILATGCGPRWALSLESRLIRLLKKPKKWNWTTIEPGLIVGSVPRWPCHLEELKAEGVGAVLALNESWELTLSPVCVEDCNMVSRQLPTPDYFAPSQRDIVEAVVFINRCLQQGISVYVHCNGGRGRSVVCVICYLVYEHNWSPEEAFEFIKGKRKVASMKAWCGVHKQWRAVKRFARDLKAAHNQLVDLAQVHQVQKKGFAKVTPIQTGQVPVPQLVNGTPAEPMPSPVPVPVPQLGNAALAEPMTSPVPVPVPQVVNGTPAESSPLPVPVPVPQLVNGLQSATLAGSLQPQLPELRLSADSSPHAGSAAQTF